MLGRTCHLMYWLQRGCDGGWVAWVLVGFAWVAPEPSEGWKLGFPVLGLTPPMISMVGSKIYMSIHVSCIHLMSVHELHMCGFIHVYVIHHDVYILSISYPCLPTYIYM